MKKVKFSECVEYMIKGPFGSDMKKSLYVPRGENTYKVYIQGNAIQKDQSLGDYYVSNSYFHEKLERFEVHPGDYIITCDGTLGKYIKLDENIERGVISSSLLLLKLKDTVIYDKYFELFWEYSMLGYLASQARNACLVHLPSAKVIGDVEILLPDLKYQIEFADRAFLVHSIIEKRTEELTLLDDLIKARFVEMFVSKNYPREELDSLSFGKGEYGAQSASVEYDPNRPRYVRITDINDDGSLNEDYVCSSNIEDDETYKLTYGDFCFARMGATVGKTYAYKSGNQIFAGYLIRYKLRLDKIIPEYLYEFTRLDEYWNWVLLNQSGAAQPGINAKKYGSLMVPVAPLGEQQKFTEFVKQVDKSKVVT